MGVDSDKPGQKHNSKLFAPGDIAEVAGEYLIVDEDGTNTGESRWARKGEKLPATPGPRQRYRFRPVEPVYTTVTSATSIAAGAHEFSSALKRLAKK